ncbi:aldo/keto reductase [Propionivibrio sp.]|uniref:aldo/keto reductase n=1 Tax=Propionivibrio sp. TaxID=2212460 RepID=UPI0025FBB7F9|nr:aldo/keto reductase [Propionivibrio sp.]
MKLALGTAQFGLSYGIANTQGQISRDEARAIIDLAASKGVKTLDTAVGYGDSELRLGELDVKHWQVVSKLPALPDGCSDVSQWVRETVVQSLKRLNVDALYGLLMHRPQQLFEREGANIHRALRKLQDDGLVRKIGVSIYDPSELDAICDRFPIDLVQAPFNVLDHRLIETGWLSRMHEQGMELHVRSIFLQGLLLMAPGKRPPKFDRWNRLWRDWHQWLAEANLTPLEACLGHALSYPEIGRVIVGVDSL